MKFNLGAFLKKIATNPTFKALSTVAVGVAAGAVDMSVQKSLTTATPTGAIAMQIAHVYLSGIRDQEVQQAQQAGFPIQISTPSSVTISPTQGNK